MSSFVLLPILDANGADRDHNAIDKFMGRIFWTMVAIVRIAVSPTGSANDIHPFVRTGTTKDASRFIATIAPKFLESDLDVASK
jgi:hypothetical protein